MNWGIECPFHWYEFSGRAIEIGLQAANDLSLNGARLRQIMLVRAFRTSGAQRSHRNTSNA